MAKVRVLYWKEIPVQVQAEDASGQVSRLLDDRFQEGVDAIAMFDGSSGTDDYLMAWDWGESTEEEGSAQGVAGRVSARFNESFPQDFVAKVRELHQSGRREPWAGTVDHWCGS